MKQTSVALAEGWEATPTWIPKQGFISTVRLEHRASGRVVEQTRFDSGKLMFLDRKEEFPAFERDALLRLARLLAL